jgi:hypothetical protein
MAPIDRGLKLEARSCKGATVRLKDEQIGRLAEKVLADLTADGLITLRKERGAVLAGIKEAVRADIMAEESLEKDAAALMEQALRSMRGGAEIDRHKMLRMIKEKLAKERKIVL